MPPTTPTASPVRTLIARSLAQLVVDGSISIADADRAMKEAGLLHHTGQRSGAPVMRTRAGYPYPYRRTVRCRK